MERHLKEMERLFTHSRSASKVCYSPIFSQTILLSLSLESLRKKFLRLGTEGEEHTPLMS